MIKGRENEKQCLIYGKQQSNQYSMLYPLPESSNLMIESFVISEKRCLRGREKRAMKRRGLKVILRWQISRLFESWTTRRKRLMNLN